MPHRVSKRGSYRIDRVLPGVGRIAVASGVTTVKEFNKRNALLTRLYDEGRHDLLRAIQARTYTVTEVYAATRENRLDELTGERAILARPLWATVEAWVGYPLWSADTTGSRTTPPSPTRRRYGVSFKALKARAYLPESATIQDLRTVDWQALKARWPRSDGDWAQLRAAVSHFLATQLGLHHRFRLAMFGRRNDKATTNWFPTAKANERVPDLDVATFWRIVNQTPEFVRPAYVTIAYLGLRVGEYLRLRDTDLLPATKQVRIPGTKTAGSAATLPVASDMWEWVRRAVPPPLAYKWLREYWVRARKAVGADDVRLHDLRHLPAQLLANAGRPEASIQSTMRHATPSMTRRYAMQRDRGENAQTLAEVLLQTGTGG
jgi:integrase